MGEVGIRGKRVRKGDEGSMLQELTSKMIKSSQKLSHASGTPASSIHKIRSLCQDMERTTCMMQNQQKHILDLKEIILKFLEL